jgi:hypothetical protein
MPNKIVPIGGKHMSAASLLAEIMNDPEVERLVIVTFLTDGDCGTAQFETTRAELCYAAALIQKMAFEDE